METLNLTRDELAKFMFDQSNKIEMYNFDLCHDIAQIVNYSYDFKNYSNDRGQIITNTPVVKQYYFYVRKTGTYLLDVGDPCNESMKHTLGYDDKYKISIIPNCDYLYNVKFAQITQI